MNFKSYTCLWPSQGPCDPSLPCVCVKFAVFLQRAVNLILTWGYITWKHFDPFEPYFLADFGQGNSSQSWMIFSGCLFHSHLPARFLSHHSWVSSLLFILQASSSSTQFIFPCFPLYFFPGSSFHPRTLSSPGSPIHRSLTSLLSVAVAPGLSPVTCPLAPTRLHLYATHVPRAGATT